MMHIAIIDRNPFIARQVKYRLEQAGYRATVCKQMDPGSVLEDGQTPDLVLIGQRSRDDCGWPCFNRWQQAVPGIPLMLYILDDCQAARITDLSQAVNQAQVSLARTPRPRGATTGTANRKTVMTRGVPDVRARH